VEQEVSYTMLRSEFPRASKAKIQFTVRVTAVFDLTTPVA